MFDRSVFLLTTAYNYADSQTKQQNPQLYCHIRADKLRETNSSVVKNIHTKYI